MSESLAIRLQREPSLAAKLSPEEHQALGLWLRDRFFSLSRVAPEIGPRPLAALPLAALAVAPLGACDPISSAPVAPREGEALFRAVVELVQTQPVAQLDGLGLSFHPTAQHKAVRFLDAERLPAEHRSLFARPSSAMPHLAAVFVDPEELSFRTFENIVPLDRLLERTPLEVALHDRVRLGKKGEALAYCFALVPSEPTREALLGLDGLGLYLPPLNAGSRGGKRFIFHSERLSAALTAAVREALPERMLAGFSHVNPIFRYNRFEPGDEKFHPHVDTPYRDARRGHVSRYTLLLYLTGGTGAPALRLQGGATLEQVPPMTAVLFGQEIPHEGSAFREGAKLFLRTELVFEAGVVDYEPAVAELFSKACYMTGESLFAPELARHAHDYYDRAALAHWKGLQPSEEAEPFVHKEFRGVHFVANGYDFWFPQGHLSLEECAALTLLDYFNCKLGEQSFRKLCTSEILHGQTASSIPRWLQGRGPVESPVVALDKQLLFPPPEEPDERVCCPFHAFEYFDPARCGEIVELYERAQQFAKRRILPAPVLLMGQEIFLDPDKFRVESDKIHVLGGELLQPVNFAACWNYGGFPPNYLDVESTVEALHLLVPPILFAETDGCWHLMFDFFRNGWMVAQRPLFVPVPSIRGYDRSFDEGPTDEDFPLEPWMTAAGGEAALDNQTRLYDRPWWGDHGALVRELYAKPK
jgi:hypothetical protein